MKPPTFIIAGAPRSGTTYLYDLFDAHPAIYMAKPRSPEPKFFLVDEEYAKGEAYYMEKYFTLGIAFRAVGEKSTNYLENAHVAARIWHMLPDVKLIFVLRQPAERAYSNYLWSCKNGIETCSFEEALALESEREASYEPRFRYARPFSYISRGFYATHLRPYFVQFPADQIMILLFEDLIESPLATSQALFEYLGVESQLDMAFRFDQKVNSARRSTDTMSAAAARYLRDVFMEPNQELAAMIGRNLDSWNLPVFSPPQSI